MRRVLANLVAVGFLLLFLAFAFMWLRSYAVADKLHHQSPSGFRGVVFSNGSMSIYFYDWSDFDSAKSTTTGWQSQTGKPINIAEEETETARRERHFIGFWFFRDRKLPQAPTKTLPGWCLVVPLWFPTILCGLIPLGRGLSLKRRSIERKQQQAAVRPQQT